MAESPFKRVQGWVLFAVLALSAAALPLGVATPPAAAAPTTFSMAAFRFMLVDPSSGRVFVAGDDKILAFNPDGSLLATIPDIFGASGMAIEGTDLFVAETTAGAIARIDLSTLTLAQTYSAGSTVTGSVAVIGGVVWFSAEVSSSYASLKTLDPTTGTVTSRGLSVYGGWIEEIPGSTTQLLFFDRGLSPYSVYRVSITTPTVTITGDVPHGVGSNLQDVAATPNGTFVTASGSPYRFDEFSLASMTATGVQYQGTNYPTSIAYTPGAGGVFVGGVSSSKKIYVARQGTPTATNVLTTAGDVLQFGTEVAPDASRAYALTNPGGGTKSLETFALGPVISSVSPGSVVAGVPADVTLVGDGFGSSSVTSVTVGGLPAIWTISSTTSMRVTIPTSLAAGTYPLVISGPFGSASVDISVAANTGAVLTGAVRDGVTPVEGVELTLSGGGLAGPQTATTNAAGNYTFGGIPYGTTYRTDLHDPTGTYGDQVMQPISLVPNQTTTLNFYVQSPPLPVGAQLARVDLPSSLVRDLEVDDATGRVFVSTGDEVVAFSRDGVLLARFQQQGGADGLDIDGTSLYVNLKTAGLISRIDTVTLGVTGSWSTTASTDGALAFAAGKVWFTDDNDQWVGLGALDPTTGLVQKGGFSWYVPRLGAVRGAPNQLLAWDGLSPSSIERLDASTFLPTLLAETPFGSIYSPTDVVGSATSNRVWPATGKEFNLTTMQATGMQYPVGSGGAVAYSAAMGGILAFGRNVVRQGVPAATHVLPDTPATRAMGIDATGDRVFYATSSGDFVVWSLRPHLSSVNPNPGSTLPGSGTLTGTGLGSATEVTIDGLPVSFTVSSSTTLTVTSPGLTEGSHPIRVTTPWGTSDPLNFFANAPPSVTNLSPASVLTKGATPVTITGTDLTGATAVYFGDVPATSFVVDGDTQITAVAPAHVASQHSVVVLTPYGWNSSSPVFSWVAPQPQVTSVTPSRGPVAGGTEVIVRGSGFSFATGARFGPTAATSFTVVSDSEVRAVVPPRPQGLVSIYVTTAGGTNTNQPSSWYVFFDDPPTVWYVSPNSGLASGGNSVTIKGTGFIGTSSVKFATTPASSYLVVDNQTIVAVVPPHAKGLVNVWVTTPNGTNLNQPSSWYLFRAPPPDVTSVSPGTGPVAGGQLVTIRGSRFTGATAVKFGQALSPSFVVVDPDTIVAISPPGAAGLVTISVTTPDGTSPGSLGSWYGYVNP